MMRRFNFESTVNTRDLGGYPTGFGGFTLYNRFIRSDAPYNLSDDEIEFLRARKITTIVDFRSNKEASEHPCRLASVSGFDYHHFPMSGDGEYPQSEEEIPVSYFKMVLNEKTVYGIMKVFAESDNGVLYHCSAGKDRTGVISALLLSLAEVPLLDIIADYQVSSTYIKIKLQRLFESDPTFPAWLGQSNPEYMFSFFKLFHEKYSTVSDYLTNIGLSQADITKIKNKLVTE